MSDTTRSADDDFAGLLTDWLALTSIDPATIATVTIDRRPDGSISGMEIRADEYFRFTTPPRLPEDGG